MLALERRPVEPRARTMFIQVRAEAFTQLPRTSSRECPELDRRRGSQLVATYAMAGADGLFIAKEIGGDAVDLVALFELHARLVFDGAIKLLGSQGAAA